VHVDNGWHLEYIPAIPELDLTKPFRSIAVIDEDVIGLDVYRIYQ
jgi:hypothetical protein